MLARVLVPLSLLSVVVAFSNGQAYVPSFQSDLKFGFDVKTTKHLHATISGKPNHKGECVGIVPVEKLAQCSIWVDAAKVSVVGEFLAPAVLDLVEDPLLFIKQRVRVTWRERSHGLIIRRCHRPVKVTVDYRCAHFRHGGLDVNPLMSP